MYLQLFPRQKHGLPSAAHFPKLTEVLQRRAHIQCIFSYLIHMQKVRTASHLPTAPPPVRCDIHFASLLYSVHFCCLPNPTQNVQNKCKLSCTLLSTVWLTLNTCLENHKQLAALCGEILYTVVVSVADPMRNVSQILFPGRTELVTLVKTESRAGHTHSQ